MAINSLYPQTAFLDQTERPNHVWQIYLQSIETSTLNNTANATALTTTVGALSTTVSTLSTTVSTLFNATQPAVALPAAPLGYTVITVNGTRVKVPYYQL